MDHTKVFTELEREKKTVVREEWLAERRRDKSHVADNREQSQTKSWDMCFGGKKKREIECSHFLASSLLAQFTHKINTLKNRVQH